MLLQQPPGHESAATPESAEAATPWRAGAVCLASTAWPAGTHANGIVSYTGRLVHGLAGLGVQTTIFANKVNAESAGDAEPDAGRVRVVDLSSYWEQEGLLSGIVRRAHNRLVPTGVSRRTRRMLMRWALQRVRAEGPVGLFQIEDTDGAAEFLYRLNPDFPVVVRLHGPWFLNGTALGVAEDRAYRARVEREGEMIRRADAITAPSQDVLDQTRAFYNLPLEHARVIPNPIADIPAEVLWDADRSDANRVLFVGRFDKHKGADIAIRAFAALAADRPNLALDFVGPDRGLTTDSGEHLPLGAFLDQAVPDPGVRGRIRAHGTLPGSEIQRMRATAGAVIVPSRYETFGNVALEGMLAGAPVVVSDTGGLKEVVTHEKTGLTCPVGDVPGWSAAVARLLDDRPYAAALGREARRVALERHAPETIARQTLAFYDGVVARYHGAQPNPAKGIEC